MPIYFKVASASVVPSCKPGQERELLKDVVQKIDELLKKSDVLEKNDVEPLKQQTLSALRSLAFTNKQEQRFDRLLTEVEKVRLSGFFPIAFPVSQTIVEQLEAQLRQLKNLVTFALDRLPADESKTEESHGARALRHEIIRLYNLHRNDADGYVFSVCAGLDQAGMPIHRAWVKELEKRGVPAGNRNWEGAYTERDLRHRVEAYLSRVTKQIRQASYREQTSAAHQAPTPTDHQAPTTPPAKHVRHSLRKRL